MHSCLPSLLPTTDCLFQRHPPPNTCLRLLRREEEGTMAPLGVPWLPAYPSWAHFFISISLIFPLVKWG